MRKVKISAFAAVIAAISVAAPAWAEDGAADAIKDMTDHMADMMPGKDGGDDDKQAVIDLAMSAAPESVSKDATILGEDGEVLREGTNGWTCMPHVMPGDGVPMCNDEVWGKFMAAMSAGEAPQVDRVGVSYMLQGDIATNNDDPTDTTRDEGEPWVQEGPHIMIVVPNPESLEGMPATPTAVGPYVMWKGTPYVHIMVPVAARPEKQP